MKKIIVIAISFYMFFMFLVYSGVFRNNAEPLEVTKYYYDCLKNWEWPLTYQVYNKEYFDIHKAAENIKQPSIDKVELKLADIKGNVAYIQAKIIYKDKKVVENIVELERENKVWLIRDVK